LEFGLKTQVPSIMKLPMARSTVILIVLLGNSGCQHIGPGTILDDRIAYNDAISTSWKEQTLLNIVRMRYLDMPEFIDVTVINSGYAQERTATGSFSWALHPHQFIMDILTFGFGGTHFQADRPNITYAPQTSSQFTRNLSTPIPPETILNLMEAGGFVDVMELAVQSINGIRNAQFAGGKLELEDPEFDVVVQAMKTAQAAGRLSVRLVPAADKKSPEMIMTLWDQDFVTEDLALMRRLLRLDPEVHEFKVVFQTLPREKDEIAIRTRSVFRMMSYLILNVQVPESHLADGRAPSLGETDLRAQPRLTVYSGCKKPCDYYAAVCYQGYWFWIDQRDFTSKRSMLHLKILLALADTGQKETGPVLTLRAN
jgi:hypothetical protein